MGWLTSLFGRKPKLYTGRAISGAEVRSALGMAGSLAQLGKNRYAEVSSAAVVWLAQQARDALWKQGINRWQANATCTLFASKFATLAGELFYAAAFYEPSGSPLVTGEPLALAAGDCWFHPDSAPWGTDHAIGVAITERGALVIDPQAPDAVRPMSATELQAVRACRFL